MLCTRSPGCARTRCFDVAPLHATTNLEEIQLRDMARDPGQRTVWAPKARRVKRVVGLAMATPLRYAAQAGCCWLCAECCATLFKIVAACRASVQLLLHSKMRAKGLVIELPDFPEAVHELRHLCPLRR